MLKFNLWSPKCCCFISVLTFLLLSYCCLLLKETHDATCRLEDSIKKMAISRGIVEAKNKDVAMKRLATESTVSYILEKMPTVKSFSSKEHLLQHSLGVVDKSNPGLLCEFGVYKGYTVNFIASQTEDAVHGFDSFEGLPEDWRTDIRKGHFKMDGLPVVRENVILHKGWFNESLPVWKEKYQGPVMFLHMDADLYSSTKTVLGLLVDRIVTGTVIQFDEYFNYPGWQNGEFRAFQEFVTSHNVKYEYIGFTARNGEQVAVKILSMPSTGHVGE
jgi:hypothetical protein